MRAPLVRGGQGRKGSDLTRDVGEFLFLTALVILIVTYSCIR